MHGILEEEIPFQLTFLEKARQYLAGVPLHELYRAIGELPLDEIERRLTNRLELVPSCIRKSRRRIAVVVEGEHTRIIIVGARRRGERVGALRLESSCLDDDLGAEPPHQPIQSRRVPAPRPPFAEPPARRR